MGIKYHPKSRFFDLFLILIPALIFSVAIGAQTNREQEAGKSRIPDLLSFKYKYGVSKPVVNHADWEQKRYMPLFLDKYKKDADTTPFDFDEVIAAIAPVRFSPIRHSMMVILT